MALVVFTSGIVDEAPARSPALPSTTRPPGAGVEPGGHGIEPELTHCWALRNQASAFLGLSRTTRRLPTGGLDEHEPSELDSGREHLATGPHQIRSLFDGEFFRRRVFVAFVECL